MSAIEVFIQTSIYCASAILILVTCCAAVGILVGVRNALINLGDRDKITRLEAELRNIIEGESS